MKKPDGRIAPLHGQLRPAPTRLILDSFDFISPASNHVPHRNRYDATWPSMILTGPAILAEVRTGNISLEPFNTGDLNPNSYNYHLADTLLVRDSSGRMRRKIHLTPDGYILKPGKVYLGATLELIGSSRHVTLLLGRSSLGRLGIFLNITADLGHLGSCSHWTLELTVVQPVRIYPRMRIGQVTFWRTDEHSPHHYTGRYHRDSNPVANRDRRVFQAT